MAGVPPLHLGAPAMTACVLPDGQDSCGVGTLPQLAAQTRIPGTVVSGNMPPTPTQWSREACR
jgi:hypothetical protein